MKAARILLGVLFFVPDRVASAAGNVVTALIQIWANKIRSLLTVLGIIIAVTSIISVVSLVEGFGNYVTNFLRGLGTNMMVVYPGVAARAARRVRAPRRRCPSAIFRPSTPTRAPCDRPHPSSGSRALWSTGGSNSPASTCAGRTSSSSASATFIPTPDVSSPPLMSRTATRSACWGVKCCASSNATSRSSMTTF